MNPLSRLPNEILRMIFSKLPRSHILECLYVCKLWNTIATPEYFKEIELAQHKISVLRSNSLLEFDYLEDDIPKQLLPHAEHVCHLKISQEGPKVDKLHDDELFVILYSMPHLRVLDLSKTNRYRSYLDKIRNFEATHAYLSFKYLQRIILPADVNYYSESAVVENYYQICLWNSNTITHLQVHSIPELLPTLLLVGSACLYDYLSSFPNLTHLDCFNISGDNVKTYFQRSLFTSCPSLTHLSIQCDKSYYLKNKISARSYDTESLLKIISNSSNENTKEGYLRKREDKHYNLKELSINVFYESAENIYAFINPHKRLTKLKLIMNNLILNEWDESFDISTEIFKLSTRLKPIPYFTLHIGDIVINNKITEDIMGEELQLDNTIEKEKTTLDPLGHYRNYYNLISNTLQNCRSNQTCSLSMNFKGGYPSLSVDSSKNHLSIKYSNQSQLEDTYKINSFLSALFGKEVLPTTTDRNTTDLPMINILQLYNNPFTHEDANNMDILWENILSKCSCLTKLEILPNNLQDKYHRPYYTLTSDDDFSYNHEKEPTANKLFPPKKFNKLTYVDERFPSKMFFEAVSNLNITYLDLMRCIFPKDNRNNITLNFERSFPNLEYLYFDIIQDLELRHDHSRNGVDYCGQFLKLIYPTGEESQHLKTKSVNFQCVNNVKDESEKTFALIPCSEKDIYHALPKKEHVVITILLPSSIKEVAVISSYHRSEVILEKELEGIHFLDLY